MKTNKLKAFIITLVFSPFILGWSLFGNAEDEISTLLKSNLLAPDSLQIRHFISDEDLSLACAVWNAKNRAGGYGDFKITTFGKHENVWSVIENDADKDYCTPEYLYLVDKAVYDDLYVKLSPTYSKIKKILETESDFSQIFTDGKKTASGFSFYLDMMSFSHTGRPFPPSTILSLLDIGNDLLSKLEEKTP